MKMTDSSGPPKKKTFINNKAQLLAKVDELKLAFTQKFPSKKFSELMTITSTERPAITPSPDPNDDIQREISFYTQTLQNTEKAITLLSAEGLDKPRPNDFLAEMYKSDKVMQKVRSRLVKQQVKIQNFEEKKMRVQNRKFNKQLQARKVQEKHKEKRQNVEAINQWKEEMKEKGEKAKDLSEFILGPKKKEEGAWKKEGGMNKGRAERKEGGGWKQEGGRGERKEGGWKKEGGGGRKDWGGERKREGGEWKKEGGKEQREGGGWKKEGGGRKEGGWKKEGGGKREGGWKKEGGGRNERGLNDKSKKIQKGFGMQRNPKHKQKKQARPGKVKRMMNKNKRFSGRK